MRNYPTTRLVIGALLVFAVAALGSFWIGSSGQAAAMSAPQVQAGGNAPEPVLAPERQVGMPRFIVTDIQTRPSTPQPSPKR